MSGSTKLGSPSNSISGIQFGRCDTQTQSGTVTFTTPFPRLPIVVATIDSVSTTQIFSITVNAVSTSSFKFVKSYNAIANSNIGGGATTEYFYWIAICS